MLTPEQDQFYNRWANKVANMPSVSVHECIDKYVSCFIVFNALYNIIPIKVAAATGAKVIINTDKISATRDVLTFLGAGAISTCLNDNIQDLNDLYEALGFFNISLTKEGRPRKAVDTRLKAGLRSANLDTKMLSLLEIIYFVRCNVVHGRKGLEQYQVLLLQPLINVLPLINSLLYMRLSAFPF